MLIIKLKTLHESINQTCTNVDVLLRWKTYTTRVFKLQQIATSIASGTVTGIHAYIHAYTHTHNTSEIITRTLNISSF